MPFAIAGDGTRIHYEVTGLTKRAPVLLVQGLGGEKNFTVIKNFKVSKNFILRFE